MPAIDLLLLVSRCSGHAGADAAGSCSYLSDRMSLSAHHHLPAIRALPACYTRARLARLVLMTDERSSGSIEGEAGIAAALVLMRAAQLLPLLPGLTRDAAEPTAGPNAAAATNADTDDENGRLCVDGLSPCSLLCSLEAQSDQHHRPAATH